MGLPHQSSPSFSFHNAPLTCSTSIPEMARIPCSDFSFHHNAATNGEYKEELWQACAGPLVSVPKVGERVLYFPQGHIEQVAASTGQSQGADQLLPQYNLPSQIPCRVISRELSAEVDSDEVFAQIALLPVPEVNSAVEDEEPLASNQRTVRIFTKILTASDTSTHGGFSVLRKHAEDCLPPLDMSQENPTQELTATDLHGQEWKFRHTYRGHPRRHLLTTGWSHFVSQKKLVAGDAVVFLRGEIGELRVGIRRTKRQPSSQSSNVLTSDCMHMGLIASAAYAIQTRTMFSVFYKPRASPSSFIVPDEKFRVSLSTKLSVGMRFKMKFEGEDATERSYAGTITGMEDLNIACWPNSKWRSLRVNWDEFSNHEQCERISPWEIELCVHPQSSLNASPGPRSKRIRGPPNVDLGTSGRSMCGEPSLLSLPSDISGSYQLQDMRGAGSAAPLVLSAGGMLKAQRHVYGPVKLDLGALAVECRDMVQPQVSPLQGRWVASGNMDSAQSLPTCYTECVSQLGLDKADQHLQPPQRPDHPQQSQRPEESFALFPSGCHNFGIPDRKIEKWLPSQMHSPISQFACGSWQSASSQSQYMPTVPNKVVSTHSFIPSTPTSTPDVQVGQERPLLPLPHGSQSPFARWDSVRQEKASDNGCKIFGISLTELPSHPKLARPSQSTEDNTDSKEEETSKASLHVPEQDEPQKSYLPDKSVSSEPEISDSTYCRASKDGDLRTLASPPLRSCTKVIMKGSMVGRGVDLSKFDGYMKLLEELECMFHIEGELIDPSKGWQVAYSDDEGDMMHVGDDPWMEFCRMVRKIYIFSPEEVRLSGMSQTKCLKYDQNAGVREDVNHRRMAEPALPG